MAAKINPPDYDKPNGNSFMTLGGRPGLERCSNKAKLIVSEDEPGDDGQRGSMSMCDSCYKGVP